MSDHRCDLVVIQCSKKSSREKDFPIRPTPRCGLLAGEHFDAHRIVDHARESICRLLGALRFGTLIDAAVLMDPPNRRCRSSRRPCAATAAAQEDQADKDRAD